MHLQQHLSSAQKILEAYDGDMPFAAWLKHYFREHKKFGSKDRKKVADLCFCYFRLGNAFAACDIEERLLVGQFLCHEQSLFIKELKREWRQQVTLPIKDKIVFLDPDQAQFIFPFSQEPGDAIDKEAFQLSFLQQPDLFIRVRPGNENIVAQRLSKAGVAFIQEDGACLRLPNSTKVDELLTLDAEAVVQDINSQKVLRLLQRQIPNAKPQTAAWDCCAASGGKSILLHDTFAHVNLTVSDIRGSIIYNLQARFKRAGIRNYRSFVADVSSAEFSLPQKFDVVICDAPCSGSGTWARTPEQLRFFQQEKLEHYTLLQKGIALNASRSLRQKGFLLYITCSVFKKENEDVVHFLEQQGLRLLSQEYFKGYTIKGDTLFAALFTTS